MRCLLRGFTVLLILAGGAVAAPRPSPDEFALLQFEIRARGQADNARLEREAKRPESLILESDRTPVDVAIRRTRALLAHLRNMPAAPDLADEETKLRSLEQEAGGATDEKAQRELFSRLVAVRRRIALKNPLLDFDRIVFVKRHRALFEHMCDQFYGAAAQPGGGVFELRNAFSDRPEARDILKDNMVSRGRLAGQKLRGGTPGGLAYDGVGHIKDTRKVRDGGAFLSPDLSFDGKQIAFAYVECDGDTDHYFPRKLGQPQWHPGRCYHLFKVNLDGSDLEQLSDGPFNDFDPCFLPDGRIAFVSDRRGGYLRCDRVCPTYTMYSMAADGSDIRRISHHETHEWHPSVDHDGMLVYTRWDYVDRDSDVAHHLWTCLPDGSNPRSSHGNYPPKRELRPWMEMSIRAIPGARGKYVATAAPHHGQMFGSLVLIDLNLPDDGAMGQLKRLTPEVCIPESEAAPGVPHPRGAAKPRAEVFGTPWPLSEDFYLAAYSPGFDRGQAGVYGLYLIDSFGNRELIYRDEAISCMDPVPVKARPTPPTLKGTPASPGARGGEIAILDVYQSLRPWPDRTKIREIRVIELFPKTTPPADKPRIGVAAQSIARGVIGTAPVEADGSAFFQVPAEVPIYFQALDEHGVAVQTMRSATFVQKGQRLSCIGCHERKDQAPPQPADPPLAMRRAPSSLKAEPSGSYPLEFPTLLQATLDTKCVQCHQERKAISLGGQRVAKFGWSQSFHSLQPFAWGRSGGNGIALTERQYSIPGQEGALGSKLYNLLKSDHYGLKLDAEEMRRFTLWLDANSNFYGDYSAYEPPAKPAGK